MAPPLLTLIMGESPLLFQAPLHSGSLLCTPLGIWSHSWMATEGEHRTQCTLDVFRRYVGHLQLPCGQPWTAGGTTFGSSTRACISDLAPSSLATTRAVQSYMYSKIPKNATTNSQRRPGAESRIDASRLCHATLLCIYTNSLS